MRTKFIGNLIDFNKLSMEELEKLNYVDFENQNLNEVPHKIFLCKNLIDLNLSINRISVIPSSIETLENLTGFGLTDNLIKKLPASIGNLKNLRVLYLDNNSLQELPSTIGDLESLEILSLDNNKLQKIPTSLESLTNLKHISIRDNLLQNIPYFVLSLKNLQEIFISGNPLHENPALPLLKKFETFDSYEEDSGKFALSLLKYLYSLDPQQTNTNKKYFSLQIEKELQTPVLHYILFFKDYVKGSKKQDIHFEVERIGEDTLMLVTNGRNEVTAEEMREYFEEYVDLTRTKMDDWVLNVDARVSKVEGDILRLKLENEIGRFKNAYKIAQLENNRLKDELDFLRRLTLNFSEKPITLNLKLPAKSIPFNPHQLLLDLQNKAIRLLERKYIKKLEDLHTDEFTDFLRDKGYTISDQSRSGRAKLRAGEIDIMVRSENGTPISIIEAFRLDSCGSDNIVVGSHLDKLMHDYDTVGHATNFVLVYAEAKKFANLWNNYVEYVNELNSKPSYRNQYPLLGFKDTRISQKTDLKIGLAQHERNGQVVEVYHVFINMFVD